MTIQGYEQTLRSHIGPLQLAMDNGAKPVLAPAANKRHFLDAPGNIFESIDPVSYSDPTTAALNAIRFGQACRGESTLGPSYTLVMRICLNGTPLIGWLSPLWNVDHAPMRPS